MTVKELIKILEKIPQNSIVRSIESDSICGFRTHALESADFEFMTPKDRKKLWVDYEGKENTLLIHI